MVLSLHSIIVEYERVILGRLAKGSDSKINAHCEKSCLEEALDELEARLGAIEEDPIDRPEMKREAQRVKDLIHESFDILEPRSQSEGNADTGEKLLPAPEKSNGAYGMGL